MVHEMEQVAALSEPMDRAGVGPSAMALMKLMENRWKHVPLDKWTPEIRSAYKALNTMVRYLMGE